MNSSPLAAATRVAKVRRRFISLIRFRSLFTAIHRSTNKIIADQYITGHNGKKGRICVASETAVQKIGFKRKAH
jgi:hypothetical protein